MLFGIVGSFALGGLCGASIAMFAVPNPSHHTMHRIQGWTSCCSCTWVVAHPGTNHSRFCVTAISSVTAAADPTNTTTVGSIVDDYLRKIDLNQTGNSSALPYNFTTSEGPPYIQQTPQSNPDGSVTGSGGQIYTPVNFTDVDLLADQLTARNEQQLPPPTPAVEDTETGWTPPGDVYDPCENGTNADGTNCDDLYALEYGVERPRSPDAGSTTPAGGSVVVVNATQQQQQELVNCSSTRVNASILVNIACSNGTNFTR